MPDKRLVVTSGGPELARLRSLASCCPNITFTDWLDEAKLTDLVGNAIAIIYVPHDEDFGMSPVEAMAAGKPVIGVAEGGLCETVVPEETGMLISPPPTEETIVAAVHSLTPTKALKMRRDCEARAGRFSTDLFLQNMENVLLSGRIFEGGYGSDSSAPTRT